VTWWQAILSVVAGWILAGLCCAPALFVLDALHLAPFGFGDTPGTGWPWRVDGAWAVLADVGPLLATSFVFAGITCWYLTERNGVHARRWPLALVATIVGWLPFHDGDAGLVAVSGGGAFCIVVIAAHHSSATERRPMPWSRRLVAALAAAVVVLGAVSVAYGALHPLVLTSASFAPSVGVDPPTLKLRDGRPERLTFSLENRGPAAARVLAVALADGHALRLRVQIGGEDSRAHAPRFEPRTLEPGQRRWLYAELRYPPCRRSGTRLLVPLKAFDVRLRVAGRERTQRVRLDEALRVSCRG
jgi:hypothetical protein